MTRHVYQGRYSNRRAGPTPRHQPLTLACLAGFTLLVGAGCPDSQDDDTAAPSATPAPGPTPTLPDSTPTPTVPDTTPTPAVPTPSPTAAPEPTGTPIPEKLPALYLETESLDFGSVPPGESIEQSLAIENRGAATLTVDAYLVPGTGPFSVADTDDGGPLALSPGEVRSLTVVFSPAEAGDFGDVLALETNDPTWPVAWIPVHGTSSERLVDEDEDGYTDDVDCNDQDPDIHPDADEVCDGIDQDCDGTPDDGVQQTYYLDADGDGQGDPTQPQPACAAPDGYVANAEDCDDGNADIYTGAIETCNHIDDDCDTIVDDGVEVTFYRDSDGDGQGDPMETVEACTAPSGYTRDDSDCDDSDATVFRGAPEVCNGRDDDCDTVVDDGVLRTFHPDDDEDGHGDPDERTEACTAPDGWVADDSDCDDSDPNAYPGAEEVCGDADLDCDGETAYCADCKTYLLVGTGTEDGVYWIDPEGNGASFPVYCDMTTNGGGWTMVYKVNQGISGDAYDLWTGGVLNEFDEDLLSPTWSDDNYVSRIPMFYWNMDDFSVDTARVHLYEDGALVKFLQFDARGTSSLDWFSPEHLQSSSWVDILSETRNYFSLAGDESLKRRFFINRSYAGCPEDYGWLVAAKPGGGCSWEIATPGTRILYAPDDTYVNWTSATNDGTVGFPDVLAVFVR